MKRILSVLIICISMLCAVNVSAQNVNIYLNGEELVLDTNAYINNDRTMVPLRGAFEAVGAKVSWDAQENMAIVAKTEAEDTTFIFVQIGSSNAFVNSEQVELDAPAEIVNDRTMVPLRFIMENLGAMVNWDAQTNSVYIVTE